MSKKLVFLLSFCVFLLAPQIVGASVIINEVLYDPEGTDAGLEHIVLYNNGDSSYSLTNHCLYASGEHYVFNSFNLGSKEKIIIHWNADGTNSSTNLYTGKEEWSNMGNTSGTVALFSTHESHKSSTIIDFIQYGAEGKTWETIAVSAEIWTAGDFITDVDEGKTIKLKTDGVDNNSSSDWEEPTPSEEAVETTTEETTTPSTYIPIADAGNDIIGFISKEISFDGTNSYDPNGYELAYSWNMGNGELIEKDEFTYVFNYPGTYLVTLMVYNGRNYAWDTINVKIQNQEITISEFIPNPIGLNEEWIEIYNQSDSIIDISNWQLENNASESQPFIFPQNTLIAPKNYLVFSEKITGIALDNDKDSVRLLLPEGIVFQEVSYEDCKQGQSSALINEEFIWSVPTPGIVNINSIELIEKPDREIVYQGEPLKQTTKESPQEPITKYIPPAQESIFANPLVKEIEEDINDDLAMVESLLTQTENEKSNQSILNLILMIIAVVLAGLIIGLFLTKLSKKFP